MLLILLLLLLLLLLSLLLSLSLLSLLLLLLLLIIMEGKTEKDNNEQTNKLAFCLRLFLFQNMIDGAAFLGVGFDGRGEYSPESRKMSIVQRNCKNKAT